MTRQMKDSGVEWIGKIPKQWDTRRLKVALLREKEIVDKYNGENILSLTMNGVIVRDLINPKGKMPTTFDGYQKICKGSLITCLFDIDVTPRCVGIAYSDGLTSPAYTQYKVKNNFCTDFIYYYLLMLDNDKILVPITKSLRNTIKSEDFLNLEFSFPDFISQKKIAEYITFSISKINQIISDTQKSIEELKKYKQSLITEIVTKGLDKNVKMKDSEIGWIGKTPVNWNVIRIKNILSEKNEKSLLGNEEPLSMSQKFGLIPSKNMDNIPNTSASYVGNKKVEVNDLVFNKLKAHLGVFAVSNYDGIVSPDYAVYQVKNGVDASYLEFLFKTPQAIGEFIKYSKGVGAGLTRLYTHEFFNIKIALPDLEEQKKIVKHLKRLNTAIDSLIIEKQKIIQEYEQYKKSLIYEYVTGKKQV